MVKINIRKFLILLCWSLSFFSGMLYASDETQKLEASQRAEPTHQDYLLGPGDQLKIIVFNQQDLSGEYTINGAGHISLPLIGDVSAKELTAKKLEQAIIDKLKPEYLLNPRVSVQVMNYRPFYILGEVKQPQSYPYVDGMTYLNAVAIAGGYTYRAKEDYVVVIRMNDPQKRELELKMNEKVMPGDVIYVKERFF